MGILVLHRLLFGCEHHSADFDKSNSCCLHSIRTSLECSLGVIVNVLGWLAAMPHVHNTTKHQHRRGTAVICGFKSGKKGMDRSKGPKET